MLILYIVNIDTVLVVDNPRGRGYDDRLFRKVISLREKYPSDMVITLYRKFYTGAKNGSPDISYDTFCRWIRDNPQTAH